ncbi:sugar phosphate exchanger 3-like isoform X3 [Tachypleus tridentatus]|uniref:sugar phosphate exchanger 3-like isoform X3 n=1 Tax=Tachypleus tridentatus TaxID=6853 RepID=UPI003FD65712
MAIFRRTTNLLATRSQEQDDQVTKCSSWTHYHFSAFFITFFSYAIFHATRKTFSNLKTTIEAEWTPFNRSYPDFYDYEQWNKRHMFEDNYDASFFLGTLDTIFMVSYSVGLFFSGALGDRFDLRKVLAIGMWFSAIMTFLFGTVSGWLNIYNYYWYLVFWMLGGLAQSSGWPCVIAIIGNWFGKSSRGLVTGLWGASPSVGNIIGAYTVASVLHFGFEYAFLVPASLMFSCGIVVYFSIIPSSRDVGLPEIEDKSDKEPLLGTSNIVTDTVSSDSKESLSRPDAVSFSYAVFIPGVIPYSLSYACLKMVNYSFFFWLPYYLQSKYGWSEAEADRLSVWYDVGGIVGGVVIGLASDKLGVRSPVMGIMLLFSPVSLLIYRASGPDKLINAVLMSICGFFISGAANLISTAIAADLGKEKELSGNKEALATVTGIVDGTGSAGAAVGQLLVPLLQRDLGWNSVFCLFMVMTIVSLLCIIKIIIRDIQDLWKKSFCKKWVVFDDTDDYSLNS